MLKQYKIPFRILAVACFSRLWPLARLLHVLESAWETRSWLVWDFRRGQREIKDFITAVRRLCACV